MLKTKKTVLLYGQHHLFGLQSCRCVICGIIAGLLLYLILYRATDTKYQVTLTTGLLLLPGIFFFKDKEKLLLAGFLFLLSINPRLVLFRGQPVPGGIAQNWFFFYFSDLLLIALICSWLLKAAMGSFRSRNSAWKSELVVPLILWLVAGIMSLVPAVDRVAAAAGVLRMVRMFATFLYVYHYIKQQKDVRFMLDCLLGVLLLQSLLMCAQCATGSLLLEWTGRSSSFRDVVSSSTGPMFRPVGTMDHSSDFAKFFGLLFPVAVSYFFFSRRAIHKLFGLSVCVCGSVALMLSVSRAGIATWLLSLTSFALGAVWLRLAPLRRVMAVSVVTIVVLFPAFVAVGGSRLKARMTCDEGSAASRIPMFLVALDVIKAHPLTGVGLMNYAYVHHDYDDTPQQISREFPDPVHNVFLLYAAEIGLLGLSFFVWFCFRLLKNAMTCAKRIGTRADKAIFLGAAVGVTAVLLQSMTGKGLVDHVVHLSSLAVVAACVAKQRLAVESRKFC